MNLARGLELVRGATLDLGNEHLIADMELDGDPFGIAMCLDPETREIERACLHPGVLRQHHPCAVTAQLAEQTISRTSVGGEKHHDANRRRHSSPSEPRERRDADRIGGDVRAGFVILGLELRRIAAMDRCEPVLVFRLIPRAIPEPRVGVVIATDIVAVWIWPPSKLVGAPRMLARCAKMLVRAEAAGPWRGWFLWNGLRARDEGCENSEALHDLGFQQDACTFVRRRFAQGMR